MGAYHLWHPSWIATRPPTLEAFVTLGEAFYLARGSVEVATEIAHTAGASGSPSAWTFVAERSHYFTDNFDDSPWEDRWNLAWHATVELAAVQPLVAMPPIGFVEFFVKDPTYAVEGAPDDWPSWRCRVIADFRDQAALDRAHGLLAKREVARHTVGKAYDRFPQLRIDLGERPRAWYEDGAKEAEALLAALRAAGASVRFDETMSWLA